MLERYRYTFARGRHRCCCSRRGCRGSAQQVNGAYLGVKIGPLEFQPAEFSKICIVIFLASYLREHREVLIVGARRIAGVTLPPLKHLGPLLVVWGASMFMLVFIRDLGSSLMFFAAFLALLYVATGRLSFVVDRAWRCSWSVPGSSPRRSPTSRIGSTSGSTRTRIRQDTGYQILQSMFAQADGGLFGSRASARP